MKNKLSILSVLLCSALAYGQGGLFRDIALNSQGRPAGAASVRTCLSTDLTCPVSDVVVYSNATLTTPKTVTADNYGNFSFYGTPGPLMLEIQFGTAIYRYPINVPIDPTIAILGRVGIGMSPINPLDIFYNTASIAGIRIIGGSSVSPVIEFKDANATPNRWWVGTGAGITTDGKFLIYDARQTLTRFTIDTAGKITLGNITTFYNTQLNLYSASTPSPGRIISPIAPPGPFITIMDTSTGVNNGGGFIFGAQGNTYGAMIKYALQNGSNNSTGDIIFSNRHLTTDANLSQVLAVRFNGLTIGNESGGTGGGITGDGGGLKHIRTLFNPVNGAVDVSVTWVTAFADTSYTTACNVLNGNGDTTSYMVIGKSASTLVVRVIGTAAHTGAGLDCIAIHDSY